MRAMPPSGIATESFSDIDLAACAKRGQCSTRRCDSSRTPADPSLFSARGTFLSATQARFRVAMLIVGRFPE